MEALKSLKNEIKQKQEELNELRLQNEIASFRLMLNTLSNKEKFQLVKDVENAFNISFKINKFLWLFKDATYYTKKGTDGFWCFDIDKNGLFCRAWNTYSNPIVKKEIQTLINICKKYIKNNRLAIYGLEGIEVPEFVNSGLRIISV